MSPEEHKARHKELHAHLDELFADYIANHPEESSFTQMPMMKFIQWSYEQTLNPTDIQK